MNTMDIKLSKLQERQAALTAQAKQLHERAAHLERVRLNHAKKLSRRIDAHEKIVLGALVKKAGLDKYRLNSHVITDNDNDMTAFRMPIDGMAAAYDRQFVVGALLWLATTLSQPAGKLVAVPHHDELRDAGKTAGEI